MSHHLDMPAGDRAEINVIDVDPTVALRFVMQRGDSTATTPVADWRVAANTSSAEIVRDGTNVTIVLDDDFTATLRGHYRYELKGRNADGHAWTIHDGTVDLAPSAIGADV